MFNEVACFAYFAEYFLTCVTDFVAEFRFVVFLAAKKVVAHSVKAIPTGADGGFKLGPQLDSELTFEGQVKWVIVHSVCDV